jgi:hypothetical protein
MKTNLTTEQGRKSAIEQIEQSFINSLRDIGVELSEEVVCSIHSSCITIGIKPLTKPIKNYPKMCFASEVGIDVKQDDDMFGARPNKINFCTSGSFDNTQREGYWRTIHAASILKNWEKVCETVNEHCKMYSELAQEIYRQNPN